jgi:uncharacterized membrane protein HdeD (DUF308 family)
MKDFNFKNSELLLGFILLALGLLIFAGITNSYRYLGLVFLVAGIAYFIRILYSKSSHSADENLKSRTRDEVYKYRHKR